MQRARCIEKGLVAWLTGLPGSGKTTIATLTSERLRSEGYRVEVIDGDWARKTVSEGTGFTREERLRHIKRIAWIARLLARNGVIVITSLVSPYREARQLAREIIAEDALFLEVYVKASLETVVKRDPKGLYRKALQGEIQHMTGISDPYEPPESPDLVLDTEQEEPATSAERLYQVIKAKIQAPPA